MDHLDCRRRPKQFLVGNAKRTPDGEKEGGSKPLPSAEKAPTYRVAKPRRPRPIRGDQPFELGINTGGSVGEEVLEFIHPMPIIIDRQGLINFAPV